MKRFLILLTAALCISPLHGQTYQPAPENIEAREWFKDARFGLFIHWGVYSIPGNGEWVMEHTKIPIDQYEKLPGFFNPVDFDPAEWVGLAKEAGMKYITITSKHHDGFAMFDSGISDYDIVDRTPYGKDVLKALAEECRREGIGLFFYYSQLDWHHPDFYPGGRTGGKYTGRDEERDFPAYLDYQHEQLKELLTGYGDIAGIWFDGWWDNPEADWQLEKTYQLIHSLQPGCLIGNNHHVKAFPGEDFQMFEKDLPGHNTTGWAGNQAISRVLLETCHTISGNGSWGFSIYDTEPKKTKTLIHFLVRSAGYDSNFLLNTGPMPNGKIRPEAVRILREIGMWMDSFGETIYGTRGGPIPPRPWGVTTQKENRVFVHILDWEDPVILIPPIGSKVTSARFFREQDEIEFSQNKQGILLHLPVVHPNEYDLVIELVF